jgi:hypothetical protein
MFNTTMYRRTLALAVAVACATPLAHADERESLEVLRQTTQGLIEALVEQGVLPRAKADAMLAAARQKATAVAASQAPAATTDKPGTIRVPYVSQAVKDQLRNEIREEVVAQARAERWGVPNSAAAWTDRIKVEGDIRLRHQSDHFGKDNAAASAYDTALYTDGGLTRAADFTSPTVTGLSTGNTTESRDRLRLRARLDISAKVSDTVGAGLRLSTGSTSDRVSTNQTLGQDFNKYTILLDRAYIKYEPLEWLSITGGRIPNPWFSTEMVWSENLNFEGVAVSAQWPTDTANGFKPFATAGLFPIREDNPPTRNDRWLYGLQVGANWQINALTQIKFGLAQYEYKNIEARVDSDYDFISGAGTSYGQYEYSKTLRQKGNTLFLTNNTLDDGSTNYLGLASRFRPLALTVAARFAHFSPYSLLASAEYVTNTAFDLQDIRSRSQLPNLDLKKQNTGYNVKLAFGQPLVQQLGDWQVSLGYRWVGADAVLDAFTDSDLGLGGTNLRGFTLGLQYGVDRNATVGLRYLSAKQIDSFSIGGNNKFGVDTLQVEFNVKF